MTATNPSPFLPRLRFPEFKDEWQPATIGDLFDSADELERATTFESDKIITVKLHANGVVKNERTGALTGGTSYFKRRAGQFIFSKIDLLNGAFGIVPKELDGFYSSSDVPAFSFDTEHSPTFFLSWLTANYRRLEIERTGTSATLKRVSPEKFRALPILLASPAEQQKIADCLTSLDNLIAAESRKLDALRRHKQGLMQQLFPQPGESVPRRRFPEFEDAPEWELRPLEDVCEILNNRRVPITSSDRRPGPYPYYGASGIVDYVDAYIFDERLVLVGEDGAKWGAFEPTAFIADGKYWVNNHAHVLRPHATTDILLASYLTMIDLGEYVTGAAPPKMTLGKLKTIPIPISLRDDEHKAIAGCLSAIEKRITAEGERVESLKAHKKGLMQQLFPTPEEVVR